MGDWDVAGAVHLEGGVHVILFGEKGVKIRYSIEGWCLRETPSPDPGGVGGMSFRGSRKL